MYIITKKITYNYQKSDLLFKLILLIYSFDFITSTKVAYIILNFSHRSSKEKGKPCGVLPILSQD